MARPSNDPKQGNAESLLSRIYSGAEVLDGALHYEYTTTDDTATEIFLAYPREAGLTPNSVVEVTEQTRLYVPPSSMVYIEMTVLGLRIDTTAKAVHHHAKWYASVFRPTTGNMVVSGTDAIIDYVDATTTFSAGNPAQYLVAGTDTDSALAISTAGYFTLTVTGNASQTIKWKATVDKIRSLSD